MKPPPLYFRAGAEPLCGTTAKSLSLTLLSAPFSQLSLKEFVPCAFRKECTGHELLSFRNGNSGHPHPATTGSRYYFSSSNG